MKKKSADSADRAELRRRAEAQLNERRTARPGEPPTGAELRRLVHELQVHQLELEMQNEELAQSRAAVELGLQQFTDLYDFAPVGYFTLYQDGTVLRANLTGARLLGVERGRLIGRRFQTWVTNESRAAFAGLLEGVFASQIKNTVEMALLTAGTEPVWVQSEAVRRDGHECLIAVMDISARKLAEASLQEALRRVRVLSARLAEVQEAERQALARELHDQVGQNLATLGISLAIIRDELPPAAADALAGRIADAMALVADVTAHTRSVMSDLHPSVLDDIGLIAALRSYGHQLGQRLNLAITVIGDEPAPPLAPPLAINLFRIVQEAATNIAKHARARQATVALTSTATRCRLTITDDGIGFDPASQPRPAAQTGWGLLTMRERAEAFGGHFQLETRPGVGTQIVIEIPRPTSPAPAA